MKPAEEQISEQTFERRNYERLRSGSIRSVGNVALSGYEKRRYDEITSALAEALRPDEAVAAISTHYPFELNEENKIVAEEGEPIEDMLIRALRKDMKKATEDPFYAPFLPARTRHELDDAREDQTMATGNPGYNTKIVISPYSEEYDTSDEARKKLIEAHQKPYYKRAMLRISHWDGNKLHIFTRSIDNSSVDFLKQVAKEQFDYEYEAKDSTSMLGERIRLNITDESWRKFADETIQTADELRARQYGGHWKQGNRMHESKDAQEFVESQTQTIDSLLELDKKLAKKYPDFESYKEAFDEQMYNHIALLEKRIELDNNSEIVDIRLASLAAGNIARAEGKSYDMCGYVITPGNEKNVANQTGFESLMRLAGKQVECPFCEKKVVVPTEDLSDGKLYCRNCDLGIEICTGTKFSKGTPRTNRPGIVDSVSQSFSDWNRNFDNEQAEKKARQMTIEEEQKLKQAA